MWEYYKLQNMQNTQCFQLKQRHQVTAVCIAVGQAARSGFCFHYNIYWGACVVRNEVLVNNCLFLVDTGRYAALGAAGGGAAVVGLALVLEVAGTRGVLVAFTAGVADNAQVINLRDGKTVP